MLSLYDHLELPCCASPADIERNYRMLSHRFIRLADTDSQARVNAAYKILSDQHQRIFYDMFGDQGLAIIQNPVDGYIVPRVLSPFNLKIVVIYLAGILLNISNWPFLFNYKRLYTLANGFFIASPALIILVLGNLFCTLHGMRNVIYRLMRWVLVLLVTTFEIGILSFHWDGYISMKITVSYLAALEASLLLHFIISNRKSFLSKKKELAFRVIKSFLVLLYFMPLSGYQLFIPCVIMLAFSLLIRFTWFIPETLILIYLLGVRAVINSTKLGFTNFLFFTINNAIVFCIIWSFLRIFRGFFSPGSLFRTPYKLIGPSG